ncbi:MAG: hypothetical protein A3H97_07125 [Acidobacteria bacterium RIFCSPLOWO2_02_FULL_65_29]|nr:MAG: hypothetical protein A3H97_07125 [Acidobacteria bacterium RIFCSPLOWO2_02_FULL_65_29]
MDDESLPSPDVGKGHKPLDARERSRALNAAMDEAYELIDLNNREGRFALILMSGLNAAVLVGGTRSDLMSILAPGARSLAAALFGVYAVVALYFMLEAVVALRPGRFRPQLGGWPRDRADYPKGVRYFEDVIARSAESYWQAWHEVTMEQLNAELAVQVHSLCIKNNVRRVALRRLYEGLRVMTLLLAALVALFAVSAWK